MKTLDQLLKKINKSEFKIFSSPVINKKQRLYSPNLTEFEKQEVNQILIIMFNHYVIDVMTWQDANLVKTVAAFKHSPINDRKLDLATYVKKHIMRPLSKLSKYKDIALKIDLNLFEKTTIIKLFKLGVTMDKHPIFHAVTEPKVIVDPIIETKDPKKPSIKPDENKEEKGKGFVRRRSRNEIIAKLSEHGSEEKNSINANNKNTFIARLSGLSASEKTKFTTKSGNQIIDIQNAKKIFSKDLENAKLAKINFSKGLLNLTEGDEVLTERLFKTPGVNSLKDLATKKNLDWKGLIEDRYNKGLSTKAKLKKATQLEKNIADSFPTDYVSSRVKKISEPLKKFIANNQSIDIFKAKLKSNDLANYNWKSIPKKQQEEVKKELKTFQRAKNLAGSALRTHTLINSGFTSASEILNSNKQNFFKNSGLELADAKLVYQRAQEMSNESLVFLNMKLERIRDISLPISNTSSVSSQEINSEEIDYQKLFGSLHFCECDHCNSVLSPAAYFVDLLYFLKSNNNTAYEELVEERRSDLLDIKLNCDATNTTQPYLELVNEVLSTYLVKHVPALPNLRREIDEILYLPWLNPELPFEPDCMRARLLAKELDMPLFQMYNVMEAPAAVQMAEYLGLGPETLRWILLPDLLPPTSPEKYRASIFAQLFNLDFDELKILVESNTGQNLSLVAEEIDIQSYEEFIIVKGTTAIARANYLKKIFKFLRLYRHLDFELSDLELYVDLATQGSSILNPINLGKLSILIFIKNTLDLSNDELVILINGYDETIFSFSKNIFNSDDQLTAAEVMTLIGISQIDFDRIVEEFRTDLDFSSGDFVLSSKNLSLIKRNIFWANGSNLSIKDWLLFVNSGGNNKLIVDNQWAEIIRGIQIYEQIGVPVSLFDFYVNENQNEDWTFIQTESSIYDWLIGLKSGQMTYGSIEELSLSISEFYGADDQMVTALFTQFETLSTGVMVQMNILLLPDTVIDTTSQVFQQLMLFMNSLDKHFQLLEFLELSGEALSYFFENLTALGVNSTNVKQLLKSIYEFSKWMDGLEGDLTLFGALFSSTFTSDELSEEVKGSIEDVLELDAGVLVELVNTFNWTPLKLGNWYSFFNAVDICSELNWAPKQLSFVLETNQITNAPRKYYRELNAFFEQSIQLSNRTESKKEELYQKVNDQLIEAKRDALVALVQKSTEHGLGSTSKIYAHFLLDAEMSACAQVSPIKAGILSVQLFIQRCLLNVEEDSNGNKLQFDDEAKAEWEWRKNYRVWEVNRKIFLYPENYLDPDLRDDKTPIYEDLEGDIQQRDLSLSAIEKTYKKYLFGFSKVAKLSVIGSFNNHDDGLHYYFGRTNNNPHQYFYKTYKKSSRAWSHWHAIDVDIKSNYLAGISAYGRMYIFWKELREYNSSSLEDGSSSSSTSYKLYIKYCFLQEDSSWSSPIETEVEDLDIDYITYYFDGLFGNYIKVEIEDKSFLVTVSSDTSFSGYTEETQIFISIPENKFIESNDITWDYEVNIFSANSTEAGIELFAPDKNLSEHFLWNINEYNRINSVVSPIVTSSEPLSLINGQSIDNYILKNGEKYYQYLYFNSGIYPLNSYVVAELSEVLFLEGLDSFLKPDTQINKTEQTDLVIQENVPLHPENIFLPESGLDFTGPNGIYFQELYFHIPYTIAKHYNNNQKYKEADYWYKKIFDPTLEYDNEQKFWQYVPFRAGVQEQMEAILTDTAALEKYHNDPFNPHSIARLRTGAYPKSVVMGYIDNLIDWGDQLFTQDTYESINEAMMLYIIAHQLLGERPRSVTECKTANVDDASDTFREIVDALSSRNEILIEIESTLVQSQMSFTNALSLDMNVNGNLLKDKGEDSKSVDKGGKLDGPMNDPILLHSFTKPLFCVPWNDNLMTYWDTVEDRMFKIRHCLNIKGEYRQLALFEPPIDPNMLIRARAAGLNLSQITSKTNLLPYRFTYLLEKARAYVNTVHSFGQAMLSAIEKESSEALSELRSIQESNILQLVTLSKEKQIKELEKQVEINALSSSKIEDSVKYYNELVTKYSSSGFKIADKKFDVAAGIQEGTKILSLISSVVAMAPQIGAPTAITFGGMQLSKSGGEVVNAAKNFSEYLVMRAQMAEKHQNQNIRNLGWKNGLDSSKKDLELNEKSKLINEIKMAIAERDLEMHEQNIVHNEEVINFYEDKMSNQALYNLLNGHLTRLYRDAYGIAIQTAMDAQSAYQFESGNETDFYIAPDNWSSASMGLLATEKLQHQLMLLERAYLEQNIRKAEVKSHVSMAQIDAQALIELKNTGACNFAIPEELFDIQYPGQYKRKIKSVSISIPCVTGPYVNVSSRLKLESSRVRTTADLEAELVEVPSIPEGNDRIFTSTAQHDSGLLEFSFRDERYLPFEGAGVDSLWNLKLPGKLRTFNYNTISDVIFHINYTAEYDELFGESVEENIEANINTLNESGGLMKIISLKHDFPNEWYNAISDNSDMTITLTENHFSYFTKGGDLRLQSASIEKIDVEEMDEDTTADSSVGSVSGSLPKIITITLDEDEKDKELFLMISYKL